MYNGGFFNIPTGDSLELYPISEAGNGIFDVITGNGISSTETCWAVFTASKYDINLKRRFSYSDSARLISWYLSSSSFT